MRIEDVWKSLPSYVVYEDLIWVMEKVNKEKRHEHK